MKTFVRVENGIVREIIIADELPPFHPDVAQQFVDATGIEGIVEKWTFDGTDFHQPVDEPPTPIEQLALMFDGLPVNARAAFYGVRNAVNEALQKGDYEAAGFIITSVSVDSELLPIKEQMLTLLEEPIKDSVPTDFIAAENSNPSTTATSWWTRLWNFITGNNNVQ